jgi:hypothetical protein
MLYITKPTVLAIIDRFPFESLLIPDRFATERHEDVPEFIASLIKALQVALLVSAPANISPQKLMGTSAPSVPALEPATPTPTSTTSTSGVGRGVPFMRGGA